MNSFVIFGDSTCDLNKDLRENKITYIDKGLWQHADNKECIKLIAKDNKGISNVLFNIIADSINNLSDMGSSIITLVGFDL